MKRTFTHKQNMKTEEESGTRLVGGYTIVRFPAHMTQPFHTAYMEELKMMWSSFDELCPELYPPTTRVGGYIGIPAASHMDWLWILRQFMAPVYAELYRVKTHDLIVQFQPPSIFFHELLQTTMVWDKDNRNKEDYRGFYVTQVVGSATLITLDFTSHQDELFTHQQNLRHTSGGRRLKACCVNLLHKLGCRETSMKIHTGDLLIFEATCAYSIFAAKDSAVFGSELHYTPRRDLTNSDLVRVRRKFKRRVRTDNEKIRIQYYALRYGELVEVRVYDYHEYAESITRRKLRGRMPHTPLLRRLAGFTT